MWPKCVGCPYEGECGGDIYYCPYMFGDGHPDDYGNN